MKGTLLLTLIFVSSIGLAQSPTCFRFGLLSQDSLETIEASFISAIDSRPDMPSAFPGGEEKVLNQWTDLHSTFRQHLKDSNFILDVDLKLFLRFYFHKDGSIVYVGYKIISPVSESFLATFEKHLVDFSRHQNFGLTAHQPFSQCGTVTYPKNQ